MDNKPWDQLNDMEKAIRNEEFIIRTCSKAIEILDSNGSAYTPIAVLNDRIKKGNENIDWYKGRLN